MSSLLEALRSHRTLLMDGAMGTELQRAGALPGECLELWNITRPESVRQIHQAYIDAGAQCLLTNTFQANPVALARHGLQDQLEDINEAAVSIARLVTGPPPFVIGSIGPFANPLDPGSLDRVVRALGAADSLLLETWSEPLALAAVAAVRQLSTLPVLLSLTYQHQNGALNTHSGHAPEWFAAQAKQSGVAALGVNCGRDIGMADMIEIVSRYHQVTDLPLFARPNAGTPERVGDLWVYPQTPEMMAGRLPELLEAEVAMLGGCCGTTPAHVASFRGQVDRWNQRQAGDS